MSAEGAVDSAFLNDAYQRTRQLNHSQVYVIEPATTFPQKGGCLAA